MHSISLLFTFSPPSTTIASSTPTTISKCTPESIARSCACITISTTFHPCDIVMTLHPAARPVIGSRPNIRRFTRDELVGWVQQQFTGVNTILAVAGHVDSDEIFAAAEAAFGKMLRGSANVIAAPHYLGGIRSRRLPALNQVHVILGSSTPSLAGDHDAYTVAAAMLGEGMSSPLLERVREQRGLAYHADCWTDVRAAYGQFVIEASTTPNHLAEYATEVGQLLRELAQTTDPLGLERARNQTMVRVLGECERPPQQLEFAALDLFALDRVRSREELLARTAAVTAPQVCAVFAQMLEAGIAFGITGKIVRREAERVASFVDEYRA